MLVTVFGFQNDLTLGTSEVILNNESNQFHDLTLGPSEVISKNNPKQLAALSLGQSEDKSPNLIEPVVDFFMEDSEIAEIEAAQIKFAETKEDSIEESLEMEGQSNLKRSAEFPTQSPNSKRVRIEYRFDVSKYLLDELREELKKPRNRKYDWSSKRIKHPLYNFNYDPKNPKCPLKVHPYLNRLVGITHYDVVGWWSALGEGKDFILWHFNIIEARKLYDVLDPHKKDKQFRQYLEEKENKAYEDLIERVKFDQYGTDWPIIDEISYGPETESELLIRKIKEKDHDWIVDPKCRNDLLIEDLIRVRDIEGRTPFFIWALQISSKFKIKKKNTPQTTFNMMWRNCVDEMKALLPKNLKDAHQVIEHPDIYSFSAIFVLIAGNVRQELTIRHRIFKPNQQNARALVLNGDGSSIKSNALVQYLRSIDCLAYVFANGQTCFHVIAKLWRTGPNESKSHLHEYNWIQSDIPGFVEDPHNIPQPIEFDYVVFIFILLKMKNVAKLDLGQKDENNKTGLDILMERKTELHIGEDFNRLIDTLKKYM